MPSREVADLGLLSDCRTAALVDRTGEVCWWPGPRFDGASVCSSVLDPDAGRVLVTPARGVRAVRRRHLEGTLVLQTDLETDGGVLRVTDCLPFAPGAEGHQIGREGLDALVRVAEALEGDVEVEAVVEPRPDYGLVVPQLSREGAVLASHGGPERVFVVDGGRLAPDGPRASGRFTLRRGERWGLVVQRVAGPHATAPPPLDADAALASTVASWRTWWEQHRPDDGPFAQDVGCAALVLQGLTYQPTGCVIAAPTTSLPELEGGTSNWDYRFGWLRDASLTARALLQATCADEAQAYFDWMVRSAAPGRGDRPVQIAFGAGGERLLHESELDHLRGFGGAQPVRVGNAAWRQRQLDVLGAVVDVAHALHEQELLHAGPVTRAFLCDLATRAAATWREPDAGMWEVRDREEHHTASKVLCWVALDRAARLARAGVLGPDDGADPRRWRAAADELRAAVLREAWSDRLGGLAGTLGGDRADAAVLLMPSFGFLEADDPRMRATVRACEERLGEDGLLRRSEVREDEPPFLPTSFWLAAVHARAGDLDAAQAAYDAAAGTANDLGLLGEMAHPDTGQAWGNVPQALTHVALVRAAGAIEQAQQPTTRQEVPS